MKKLSVLSIVLAVLMLAMMVPAFAADPHNHPVTTGKTDLLTGVTGDAIQYVASEGTSNSDSNKKTLANINDGVAYVESGEKAYVNLKNQKAVDTVAAYELAGNKYISYIKFDLPQPVAKMSSFAVYYNTENFVEANFFQIPLHHIDREFDILVSVDSGATWQVAWQSTRMKVGTTETNSNAIVAGANLPIGQGGDTKYVVEKYVNSTATQYSYAEITGNFTKTFENVTNVAYAVSKGRPSGYVNTNQAAEKGNTWGARISEFDVYADAFTTPDPVPSGSTDPTPATGDNFVALVAVLGAAVLTAGTVLVVRKKED